MKKLLFLISFLIQLVCYGQTTPTQTQVNNASTSPNKGLIQGANSYTANTSINPVGNYSLTPSGTITERSTGLHTISSASLAISGTSLQITNNAGTGKVLTSDVSGFATWNEPYKEYVALVSQTGTLVPTATVLVNTIGSVSWTRSTMGVYELNSTGLFTANKTTCLNSQSVDVAKLISSETGGSAPNQIEFRTQDIIGFSDQDDILNNTTIIIRVYP